jgi:hypothetical protein
VNPPFARRASFGFIRQLSIWLGFAPAELHVLLRLRRHADHVLHDSRRNVRDLIWSFCHTCFFGKGRHMARPHIPNMDDIKSLANEEIRFYALAGVVMSLGAGLELAYFDLFERATKINQDIGASVFYQVLNASTRREMANAAVSGTLAGNRS